MLELEDFDPAGELQLEEDSQLAQLAQLAGEIFEEDHDGDDYRARRIWL